MDEEIAMGGVVTRWFSLGGGVLLAIVFLVGFQNTDPATGGMSSVTFVVQ